MAHVPDWILLLYVLAVVIAYLYLAVAPPRRHPGYPVLFVLKGLVLPLAAPYLALVALEQRQSHRRAFEEALDRKITRISDAVERRSGGTRDLRVVRAGDDEPPRAA